MEMLIPIHFVQFVRFNLQIHKIRLDLYWDLIPMGIGHEFSSFFLH
jgi:hypothetical protein